ncbi:MAG TPA: fumarylacetoacetate hydrolase family protein [Chloroflexia bacterium]|nr:fumarylacetoacetate hydrolase family protein [Chloroflexia bacterium]
MRIGRISLDETGLVLAAIDDHEQVFPLQSADGYINTWAALTEQGRGRKLTEGVAELIADAKPVGYLPVLEAEGRLRNPLDYQEVWAAGVTYWRSREARMEESDVASRIYDLVYEAERPELFFKATPHRVAGSGDYIAIRGDSHWNVPEPELAVLLDGDLKPLGLTICNDVSSRDIEGANPLYLPQAKVYDRCCAAGPTVLLLDELPEKPSLRIECTITRNNTEVFHGGASTAQLKRTLPELVSYLGRYNSFPNGVLLSTGTCIVPPDDFTLQDGDVVTIVIENIGALVNPVRALV